MIERYTNESMNFLNSDEAKFKNFLAVELAVLKELEDKNRIPKGTHDIITLDARIDVSDIKTKEATTKHDVVAFVQSVSETLGSNAKWFHYGLTSTDVVDTANALLYKRANDIIASRLNRVLETLKTLAHRYKHTPIMGRTHGIHADVSSFGLKMALYYDTFNRHQARFSKVRQNIETGKLSGAVGTHRIIDPSMQDKALETLGLFAPNASTQVLWRDYHAEYASLLSLIGGTVEQLAVELRHLSRTEVGEVSEGFAKKQTGSSAMPHKKNPIASENLTGCARMIRGYMTMAHENIALWHERDISHSSVERVGFIDSLILSEYMLNRLNKTLANLDVHEKTMRHNIKLTKGAYAAQHVMHALIDNGMHRSEAYELMQSLAFEAQSTNTSFKDCVINNEQIKALLDALTIQALFEPSGAFEHLDSLYKRIGLE